MPDPLTVPQISAESILSALAVGAAWAVREWQQRQKSKAETEETVPQKPRVVAAVHEAHREREIAEQTILLELRGVRASINEIAEKVDDLWRLRDQEGVPTSHRSKTLTEALTLIQQTMVSFAGGLERIQSAVSRLDKER